MKIKKGDIYVIGFLLIFSLAFAFAISKMTSREKGNILVIEQDSKVIKEVPLDKDDEFRI